MPKRIGIAVVQRDGHVLVGVRDDGLVLGGLHEFPGGKCRAGESAAECAVRECLEETGLQVEIVELLDHTCHEYEHGAVDLAFFLCRPADGETMAAVASPFTWVPLRELATLDFPDGNRGVIQKLLHRQA